MIDSFHSSGNSSFFQIEVIRLWISKKIVLPPALMSSGSIWLIPGDLWLFNLSISNWTSEALSSGTSGSQILYFNTFIILLYMFQTLVLIFRRTVVLVQHLVSSLSLGDCSDHKLWEDESPFVTCGNLIACGLNNHLKRVTIPDAVLIQLSFWRGAQ